MFSANLILSNFDKVKIETITIKTRSGHNVSVRVYKPKEATEENKAPAVVFSHGLSTTKESYAQYALELSRRRFVVATPDMLNHGGYDISSYETFFSDMNADAYGIYAAVKYVSELDYVDLNQIGIAGHSMGGNATNISVSLDNMSEKPVISAVYLVVSKPMFTDLQSNWTNIYGDRNIGLYYTYYDHVYFSTKANEMHPKQQADNSAVDSVVNFFQEAFIAPKYKISSMQIWNYYALFSFLGLLIVLAICVFTIATLTKTKFFLSLKAEDNK